MYTRKSFTEQSMMSIYISYSFFLCKGVPLDHRALLHLLKAKFNFLDYLPIQLSEEKVDLIHVANVNIMYVLLHTNANEQ